MEIDPTLLKLTAAQHNALLIVSNRLQAEFKHQLVGIIVGGSVGRGSGKAFSDLDLFVLIDAGWYRRDFTVIDGVHVDMFLTPPRRANQMILERRAIFVENFATGWIAYDPAGTTAVLRKQAIERFERGPLQLKPSTLSGLHIRLRNLADDLERAASDGDILTSSYLAAVLCTEAVEAYYQLRRQWDAPRKRRMQRMQITDPKFVSILERMVDTKLSLRERSNAARNLLFELLGEGDERSIAGPKCYFLA
jgi:hypothetical protein